MAWPSNKMTPVADVAAMGNASRRDGYQPVLRPAVWAIQRFGRSIRGGTWGHSMRIADDAIDAASAAGLHVKIVVEGRGAGHGHPDPIAAGIARRPSFGADVLRVLRGPLAIASLASTSTGS